MVGGISNCTISYNGAGGGKNNRSGVGGGIYGGRTISNCTISGNSVFGSPVKGPGLGGGIYAAGTVTISNSTLGDNYITYGNGGGICNGGALEIDSEQAGGVSGAEDLQQRRHNYLSGLQY